MYTNICDRTKIMDCKAGGRACGWASGRAGRRMDGRTNERTNERMNEKNVFKQQGKGTSALPSRQTAVENPDPHDPAFKSEVSTWSRAISFLL
jgi:hypothetical protein